MQHNLTRDELRQRLLEGGLKATHQRIVVFEAVMELHGHHPTPEEVYQHLRPANPTLSLGTVYKTLDTFVETGLIKRALSEKGGKRYDANTHVHNHIFCSKTKEIVDFEDEELEQLLTEFFSKRKLENFEIKGFSVQLTGNKVEPDKQIRITRVSK
ncbi:Fur family transcriptional regulator [Pontibacter chinhatensis]|uniref:Fur family transcriptional regulator, peroxide stress response regulator n=1 Tax=Pontibacter chinhatensis TaxID=1436961 RepID=A0A1I2YZP7_9BACT|nr:transcriptional repressor [Pontibacter chinhatensis]SFH30201.1 Fur family transcriptional regulator, peroxide stress response regulator [Pontibacter chinhatensis]